MSATVRKKAALRVAAKRLPILGDRQLRRNLDMAAADEVEAYRMGAEEAQGEILARLRELQEESIITPAAEMRAAIVSLRDPDSTLIEVLLSQFEEEVAVLPDRKDRTLRLRYFLYSHGLVVTSEAAERARQSLGKGGSR